MAAALGVSPQRISDWENGDNVLAIYHEQLAELYDQPVEAIASMYRPADITKAEATEIMERVDRLTKLVERMLSDT